MPHELVSSAANPVVKRIRALAERKHRRREGAFVVEGGQPVWRAVEAGWEIDTLLIAPDLLARPSGQPDHPALAMAEQQERAGVRVVRLSRELFERLAEREGPSGVMAIVRSRRRGLADLQVEPGSVFTVLHRIGNPGNLGTIVRTVDAAGGAGVVLVGETADELAPTAVKASMGSIFAVDVVHEPELDTFFDWARERGVRVLATSGSARYDHWQADYAAPCAILLGNEGEGLPESALEAADLRVGIPMVGTAESLNVAVAAALVLYQARRPGLGGR